MTIRLPEDVERSIRAAVLNGQFASAGDAVAAAWRSYRRRQSKQAPTDSNVLTPEELNQRLVADGLVTRLPDPAEDVDDDDKPAIIAGEPLSETIIRDRR
jgi:Arc/MetJ-type ribon-helix-helix transcriptional regulator